MPGNGHSRARDRLRPRWCCPVVLASNRWAMSASSLGQLRHDRPYGGHARAVRGRALFLLLLADIPVLPTFAPPRRVAGVPNSVVIVNAVAVAARLGRDAFARTPRARSIGRLLTEAGASARTVPGQHPASVGPSAAAGVHAEPERSGRLPRNPLNNAAKYPSAGAPITPRARIAERCAGGLRRGSRRFDAGRWFGLWLYP